MSDILSKEENNTASAEEIENAGKLMTMVTGNVLGGAVMSNKTNATAVSWLEKYISDVIKNWDIV